MDALRKDEIERIRATPPEERARQALEAMDFGIRLKRSRLRADPPDASEAEIDTMLRDWMLR